MRSPTEDSRERHRADIDTRYGSWFGVLVVILIVILIAIILTS